MTGNISEQLDKAERKRKKQEFYLNVRDVCITIILFSAVTLLVYYIALRGGYAS